MRYRYCPPLCYSVQCSSKCAFAASRLEQLTDSLCGEVVPQFALMAFWSLLMLVACVVSTVSAVMLVKRLFVSAQVMPQSQSKSSHAVAVVRLRSVDVASIFAAKDVPRNVTGRAASTSDADSGDSRAGIGIGVAQTALGRATIKAKRCVTEHCVLQ